MTLMSIAPYDIVSLFSLCSSVWGFGILLLEYRYHLLFIKKFSRYLLESLQRIPVTSKTFSVITPPTIPNWQAEAGLDGLKPVIECQEFIKGTTTPAFGNIMESAIQNLVAD